MEQGRIMKHISNQYIVLNDQGEQLLCVAMGKLRKGRSPLVGDIVGYERFDNQIGMQKIMPRKNELVRPAIANVDQAIIVMSCIDPDFSTTLIDRLIFMICYANIRPIICVTKLDLIEKDHAIYQKIQEYRDSGYDVYESGNGMASDALIAMMDHKISVLTGQSGAGKSSLLNRIDPTFQLHTQEISKALGRGKHTTRHCELHPIHQGWVADTPGFSSMDFTSMNIRTLVDCIPDFKRRIHQCRFNDCIHLKEPDCGVREGVENGCIQKERYDHYLEIVDVIQHAKIKY